MKNFLKKVLTRLTPILGAGAIGVCPLCWIGSASLLTYLGLGALIPVWRWIAFGLIALGAVGFVLDYRFHKNPYPLVLLSFGAALLYVGRYVFLSTWGAWQIWGPGAVLIIGAVIYNRYLFRKPLASPKPPAKRGSAPQL
ncbi:MerC domain-containing protein [Candidatus Gottesmanbacteria bacterium]|nr:MerC domain-containing protein [Candidatus Gottesmanbacteria bacterium]